MDVVEDILDSETDPERAEAKFIEIYRDPDTLGFMIGRLRSLPAMQPRLDLVRLAAQDYAEGRFYATTLVLLSVMDGFVNDVDAERRGLHARTEEEVTAWDDVVGHHRGLSHAHRSFIKSTKKLVTEEMSELQRHGIVHGMVVNYNNVVVATKARNRLFAVADWARSRAKQAEPKKEPPKLRESLAQVRKSVEAQKANDAWSPSTVRPGDAGFETNEVFVAASRYLAAWREKNLGRMATMVPRQLSESSVNKMAGEIRTQFEGFDLQHFEVVALDFNAPAVCEVDVTLTLAEGVKPGRMRWIRENSEGESVTPIEQGEWRLWLWGPHGMFNRAGDRDADAG
ncbi:MAG: hypothetical protein WEB06_09015 [Actinomycetota bacterium]